MIHFHDSLDNMWFYVVSCCAVFRGTKKVSGTILSLFEAPGEAVQFLLRLVYEYI